MKKNIFLFIFILISVLGIAQSNIRVNNYWEDTYFINPASIHYSKGQFSLAARKQWVAFSGAPLTGMFTATTYFDKYNTQVGLYIFDDFIGYTNTVNAKLTYTYLLNINRFWDIRFGGALCGQSLNYDISKIILDNTLDPNIHGNLLDKTKLNSDLGIEISHEGLLLGLASQNFFSLVDTTNNIFANSNFLYVMYRERSRNSTGYSLGLCGIQTRNIFQLEASANLYVKIRSATNAYIAQEAFNIGVYYRTWQELGIMFGIDLSEELHLSYTYDYNLSSISQRSFGTHEIILRYRIPDKIGCYRYF